MAREWNMPPAKPWEDDWRKRRYMDWLTTPPSERSPRSKSQLAQLLRVSVRTLENWAEQPEFRTSWERRANDMIGSPERAHQVLDALYRTAIDPHSRGHVQAAKLYLEATRAMRPQQVELTLKRPGEMSDEELDALLAQGATALRQERSAEVLELPPAGDE